MNQKDDFVTAYDSAMNDPKKVRAQLLLDFLIQVREAMIAQGITDIDMSERLGLEPEYLNCLFTGQIKMRLDLMVRISVALRCRLRFTLEK